MFQEGTQSNLFTYEIKSASFIFDLNPHMLYDRNEIDFTFEAVSRNSCSYLPSALWSQLCGRRHWLPATLVVLVVLVCVGSLANHVSMVEDFKQRAFEDCRVILGDTKDSLQGCVRVSVCGV